MSDGLPPVAILISHRVSEYDAWKKAFDDHASMRKEASCLGHHVNRGADDPNQVVVYLPASDVDKVKAFTGSPDLAEKMKAAGVVGSPTITFMRPMSADFIPDKALAGVMVNHAVEDYEKWRVQYDDSADFQKKSGIIGHAVNQELGKPNQVIVYCQAQSVDTLRAFVDSSELKERMKKAGVVGAPDIQFENVVDWATY